MQSEGFVRTYLKSCGSGSISRAKGMEKGLSVFAGRSRHFLSVISLSHSRSLSLSLSDTCAPKGVSLDKIQTLAIRVWVNYGDSINILKNYHKLSCCFFLDLINFCLINLKFEKESDINID